MNVVGVSSGAELVWREKWSSFVWLMRALPIQSGWLDEWMDACRHGWLGPTGC